MMRLAFSGLVLFTILACITAQTVTQCTNNQWGTECQACNENCQNAPQSTGRVCDIVNGGCSHGCKEGYMGQNCSTACPKDRWGPLCNNICGFCDIKSLISRDCLPDGTCPSGCYGGYSGDYCDQAHCPGGCGSGECLAPNLCGNCGEISKVSPNCEDIRLRGLLGSLIAFAVIISSITLCGLGSVWYKRRKNTAVAL